MLKQQAKGALLKLPAGVRERIAPAAHRLSERAHSLRARRKGRDANLTELRAGLPVPPPELRTKVVRNGDEFTFLRSGKAMHSHICNRVWEAGRNPFEIESLLDFGCGCGRVLRWWAPLASVNPSARIHGSDYNAALSGWADENLGFASVGTNRLEPPLDHPAGSFELVYALSVFTHLPEELQAAWLDELLRVVSPGGLLLVTTAGEPYLDHLPEGDREAFAAGEMVVHFEEGAGSNLCAAYHPRSYVRNVMLDGLDVVGFHPGSPETEAMRQDTWVVRKAA